MSISTPTVTTSHSFPAFRLNVRDFGTVVGLLLILAVFAFIAPGFLSERNLALLWQIYSSDLRRVRVQCGHR